MKENLRSQLAETEKELLVNQRNPEPVTAQSVDDRANEVIRKTENVQEATISAIGRMENTVCQLFKTRISSVVLIIIDCSN